MHIDIEKARHEMTKRQLDVLITGSLTNTYYSTGHYSQLWHLIRDEVRFAVIPKSTPPFVISPDTEAVGYGKSGVFEVYEFPMQVYQKYPPGVEDLYLKAKRNVREFEKQLAGLDVRKLCVSTPVLLLAKLLKDRGLSGAKAGIDKEYVQVEFFEELVEALPNCEWYDGSEIFIELRMVKSPEEIQLLIKAMRITEEAIESSFPMIKEGVTIRQLSEHARRMMTGLEYYPFEPLIAATPAPMKCTEDPSDAPLKAGQTVRWDIGARYNGYCADIARQVAIGDIPQEQKDFYSLIVEARNAMERKIRPGAKASDLYEAAHAIIDPVEPDYKRRLFNGHGVGIELREEPYITPWSQRTLKPGMVLAVEVPYYTAGGSGYEWNFEDMYLVTEDGHKLLSDRITGDLLRLG